MKLPLTPIRCLYRGVDLYGHKVGVVSGPCRFTYQQYGERCRRLAAGLLAEGIQPGDRVAYLSFNNNQLLEGYYGAPLIRAIVMPLNRAPAGVRVDRHSESRESAHAGLRNGFRPACGTAPRGVPQYSAMGVDRRTVPASRSHLRRTALAWPD